MSNNAIQSALYAATYPMHIGGDEYMTDCWIESKLTWGNAVTSLIGMGDPWYVRSQSVLPPNA